VSKDFFTWNPQHFFELTSKEKKQLKKKHLKPDSEKTYSGKGKIKTSRQTPPFCIYFGHNSIELVMKESQQEGRKYQIFFYFVYGPQKQGIFVSAPWRC